VAALLALLAILGVGAVATVPASIAIGGVVIPAAQLAAIQGAIELAQLSAGGIKAGTQLAQALKQVRQLQQQGKLPRGGVITATAEGPTVRLCFQGAPSGRSASICVE
jgi:hypothetical protein